MQLVKLTATFLFTCFMLSLKAQTPGIDELQIKYETASVIGAQDSMVKIVCLITLPDTVTVSNVHVKAGTAPGANDKFDHTFSYTGNATLPAGVSFSRSGNVLSIILGDFIYEEFYYEARAQDHQGNWGTTKTWNF